MKALFSIFRSGNGNIRNTAFCHHLYLGFKHPDLLAKLLYQSILIFYLSLVVLYKQFVCCILRGLRFLDIPYHFHDWGNSSLSKMWGNDSKH